MYCPYCGKDGMEPDGSSRYICNKCIRYMTIVNIPYHSTDPRSPVMTLKLTECGYAPMGDMT